MKFESLMLQILFGACLLICVLVLGAMLTSQATMSSVAVSHAPAAVTAGSAS
jgi:hypothetical protein